MRGQGVRSILPSPSPVSQLWQGSTVPSGATAMLDRQAPQLGIWVKPSVRSVLLRPAGACKVDFHAVCGGVLHGGAQYILQLGGSQAHGAAGVALGIARRDQPAAGQIADAQLMREPDHRQVVPVQAAKRCVQADVQVRSQRIFDAVHRVGVAVHADQRVVDVGIGGVERDLHRVQAGGVQVLAHHAGQHPAIGVQAGDKPLCRLHELDQIVAQRRFAARKAVSCGMPALRHFFSMTASHWSVSSSGTAESGWLAA